VLYMARGLPSQHVIETNLSDPKHTRRHLVLAGTVDCYFFACSARQVARGDRYHIHSRRHAMERQELASNPGEDTSRLELVIRSCDNVF
jgi:hypothetical protein